MYIRVEYEDSNTFDVIYIPKHISEIIIGLQGEFFKWLFDKKNNHPYWRYINHEKAYCEYDTNAFIKWINERILHDSSEKAFICGNKELNCQNTIFF